jgi:signal transduction histidine kinase
MDKSVEEQLEEARRENEQLRRALEQCRSACQRVEQDLERTLEEGRAATEDMQHLIYAVSHDLRTPLRAIAGYTQLLQRQYASNPDTSELTSYVDAGVREMNTLIEDLLRFSRAGNSPRRTHIGLDSIIKWAKLNVEPVLHETGGEIVYGELPEMYVDESQFVQVFHQLFTNSLKFRSPAPPRVQVLAEQTDEGHAVSVLDNGIGVEPQHLETIFQPFKRLDSKIPGHGLGLSTCRKIVRAHGGRIWAESAGRGHGTSFRFTIPF